MFNINSRCRSMAVLTAMVLFSFLARAMDFDQGTTVSLCDSFGKTWSVKSAACSPALPLTFCTSGARDTLNLNGCGGGAQTMFGTVTGVAFLFDAYTVESSGCTSTFWAGNGGGGSRSALHGNVYNPGGLFGGFTITLGACAASSGAVVRDPANR